MMTIDGLQARRFSYVESQASDILSMEKRP